MEDIGCNHRAWHERLGRERRPTGYAVLYQNQASRAASSSSSQQAAPNRLRGCASEPSLAPSRGSSAAAGRRGPHSAPENAAAGSAQALSRTLQGTPAVCRGASSSSKQRGTFGSRPGGWLPKPKPPASRPETGTSSSFRRSGELVLINNGRRQSIPPTPSLRSGVTGCSMDSALWSEVAQVVQQEVAKVMRPLQDQLKSEAEARQKVEEALARAGVSRGAAR